MTIAAIIPVYNGATYLEPCLRALGAQRDVTLRVIAVENGSTDDSAAVVRRFPKVELLDAGRPLGFSAACNVGIAAALRDVAVQTVVLLNQDTVVDPGFAAAIVAPLEHDAGLGVVGSLARFPDGRTQHAGGELIWPLGYGRNRLEIRAAPADYMAFHGVALRRAMLAQIGALDEGFGPAYFEDADLCLRATAAGWRIALAEDATLIHDEGAERQRGYRHAALLERNRLRLMLKHRSRDDIAFALAGPEREQLETRARAGVSQALRQAYLAAMLALPAIGAARVWSHADIAATGAALAELRTVGTGIEREVRGTVKR